MLSRTLSLAAIALAIVAAPAAASAQNYVGSDKCKTCHNAKNKGEMYTKWKASAHAKAFETLGNEQSKKIAKGDAQKDAKCLKCHTTEAAVPADKLAKSFKKEQGVGCESCHGPGDKHVKARMAAEDDAAVTDAEIVKAPGEKNCQGCHNKESPTFKGFKYAEAVKAIEHKDPSKKK